MLNGLGLQAKDIQMTMKVLIVDDSAMARKMLIKALPQELTQAISQASNGQEALAICRQQHIDLMFLDLQMPVLDGYQTLLEIRNEKLPCKVVIVSADVQPDAEKITNRLGAVAFLKKPIDASMLKLLLDDMGVAL
jgi:two-component system, chemotaxis family, chemotaxis protein CheY